MMSVAGNEEERLFVSQKIDNEVSKLYGIDLNML